MDVRFKLIVAVVLSAGDVANIAAFYAGATD